MTKLLQSDDLARVACSTCAGCGDCCRGMGDTIHLDPYDIYMLCRGLHKQFSTLLHTNIELHADNGLVLPYLMMAESSGISPAASPAASGTAGFSAPSACTFLNEEGRCTVHAFRPGLCRLFPLGRNYEDGHFDYFIVENGCDMPGKSKIRISTFLGIPELKKYERFVADWHFFLKDLRFSLKDQPFETKSKTASLLLRLFFALPYESEEAAGFYDEFSARMEYFRTQL